MKTFLSKYIRPAVMLTIILTIVTGFLYPGLITGLAQLIFPYQANGSLHYVNGKLVGSDLIGQYWTSAKYFHGRPSAAVDINANGTPIPYAADNSSASNLGPTSSTLVQTVQQRIVALRQENPDAPAGPVPVDLVTASGSGLDPDISVAAALWQVPRIARARWGDAWQSKVAQLNQLVNDHTQGRFLWVFGEPYLNVLDLNLALDALK